MARRTPGTSPHTGSSDALLHHLIPGSLTAFSRLSGNGSSGTGLLFGTCLKAAFERFPQVDHRCLQRLRHSRDALALLLLFDLS